jgi:hypothetical protein
VIATVRGRPWPTRLATGSAVFIIALGLTVLVGWFSHTPALVQLRPHLPPMTRNAAACFLLCGLALLVLALSGPRWLAVVCAGIAGVLSVLTVVEILFHVNAGVDELLGTSYIAVKLRYRGRMAPLTAAGFSLGSIGLLLAPRIPTHSVGTPRWLPISVAIAVITCTLGLWRAIIVGGYPAFALLPVAVLVGGFVIAPIFGLTVYLAQRGHAQAAALRRSEAFLAKAQRLSRTGSFSWRVTTGEMTLSDAARVARSP